MADKSKRIVDRFTLAHLVAGAGLGLTPLPLWSIAALAVGYEVAQRPIKRELKQPEETEGVANSVLDASAMIAGALATRLVRGIGSGLGLGAGLRAALGGDEALRTLEDERTLLVSMQHYWRPGTSNALSFDEVRALIMSEGAKPFKVREVCALPDRSFQWIKAAYADAGIKNFDYTQVSDCAMAPPAVIASWRARFGRDVDGLFYGPAALAWLESFYATPQEGGES